MCRFIVTCQKSLHTSHRTINVTKLNRYVSVLKLKCKWHYGKNIIFFPTQDSDNMGAHWVTARRNQETRRRLFRADAGGRPQVRRGHGEDVAVEICHAPAGVFGRRAQLLLQCLAGSPNSVAALKVSSGGNSGPVFHGGGIGNARRSHWKNLHKMALVRCPCPFRPRRLAQNDVPGRGV